MDELIKQQEEILERLEKLLKIFEVPEGEQVADDIVYEEPTTGFEAISAANYALSTLSMIEGDDLTEAGSKVVTRVKKRSLKILDWGIKEIHDSIFDTE